MSEVRILSRHQQTRTTGKVYGALVLKILKTESDGHTGHLTVHACVIEKPTKSTEVLGAPETHGIAAQQLQEKYNGNPKEWLKTVHRGMLQRHEDRKITTNALKSLQGLKIFTDEDATNGNQASPS